MQGNRQRERGSCISADLVNSFVANLNAGEWH